MRFTLLAAICSLLLVTPSTQAQFNETEGTNEPTKIALGEQLTQRWKVGMTIRALAAPVAGIYGTATVPTDWPEQTVKIVEEDISPLVRNVNYRTLNNGVKQMLVTIPKLERGESAHALITYEVTRSAILAPEDPSRFVKPAKLERELRAFLGASPYIETRNPRIRALARTFAQDDLSAWELVESMYDWVRENVEYKNGALKGAAAALQDGNGDCEELTSLFIALCRVNQIPARTVWVPGHCYPEFYLQDENGEGHWIPCQAAGTRDFGSMPELRPVLQKGDNFRVPEKREAQRYVAEFLRAKSARGASPDVKFMRQLIHGS